MLHINFKWKNLSHLTGWILRFVTIYSFFAIIGNNTNVLIIVCIINKNVKNFHSIVLKEFRLHSSTKDSDIAKDHHTACFKYILIDKYILVDMLSKLDKVNLVFWRRTVMCYESTNNPLCPSSDVSNFIGDDQKFAPYHLGVF